MEELLAILAGLRAQLTAMREELMTLRREVLDLRVENTSLKGRLGEVEATPNQGEQSDAVHRRATESPGEGGEPAGEKMMPEPEIAVPDAEPVNIATLDPAEARVEYLLADRGPGHPNDTIGTNDTDIFVDRQLTPKDFFNKSLLEGGDVLRFPPIKTGDRIDGHEGYDMAHVKAHENSDFWFEIRNLEYLRIDFPDSGGECFGEWELPVSGYVHVVGEEVAGYSQAVIYDDGFNLVAM